jgi:hypothetical protein
VLHEVLLISSLTVIIIYSYELQDFHAVSWNLSRKDWLIMQIGGGKIRNAYKYLAKKPLKVPRSISCNIIKVNFGNLACEELIHSLVQ